MSDFVDSSDHTQAQFLRSVRNTATNQILEFLTDPRMALVRTRLQEGGYGLNVEMGCRMAVLEQVGVLGAPGLRLGLLVTSLEILFSLVFWDQVATAIKLAQPERSPYLARALEEVDQPCSDFV